jgi:hypothetical protein
MLDSYRPREKLLKFISILSVGYRINAIIDNIRVYKNEVSCVCSRKNEVSYECPSKPAVKSWAQHSSLQANGLLLDIPFFETIMMLINSVLFLSK